MHKATWHIALLVMGCLAIATHIGLKFLGLSHDQIPLFLLIGLGAPALVGQIAIKIFRGNIGADILAALAIVTALWLNEYLACVLVIMMLAGGQALEAFAIRKASSVLSELLGRMPLKTKRKIGEKIETILVADIRIGDYIIIAPHDTCPIDGLVVEGQGLMDESYLTGEPYRVKKATGSQVLSGAINGDSLLVVIAHKLAKDSRYDQIIKVMKDAEEKRPKLRRLGDQLGAFFAPAALILALLAWFFSGDVMRFLAVLVVATPCPLLIAIPVTIISTISRAARHGIIIKDPSVLERLPTCTTAIFDKTGTLTYGQPVLTKIWPAMGFDQEIILQKVASLERYSKHPLAQAVLHAADLAQLSLLESMQVSEQAGIGLIGKVDNSEVLITHRAAFLKNKPEQANILPEASIGLECIVVIDQVYAATMHFRDAPRPDSQSFINHLTPFHNFNRVILLSGDRESEVRYLAQELGIKHTYSSQSPEQKLMLVRHETSLAPSLFMGDGINDAPALAAATVGIAFGQHSGVTSEAAGAVIMENTLAKVDELLHLSKLMRTIALQSALGGMILSFAAMGLASVGILSPVWGALMQQAIDVLAIANSLRIAWEKDLDIDLPA